MKKISDLYLFLELDTISLPPIHKDFQKILHECHKFYKITYIYQKYCRRSSIEAPKQPSWDHQTFILHIRKRRATETTTAPSQATTAIEDTISCERHL